MKSLVENIRESLNLEKLAKNIITTKIYTEL